MVAKWSGRGASTDTLENQGQHTKVEAKSICSAPRNFVLNKPCFSMGVAVERPQECNFNQI